MDQGMQSTTAPELAVEGVSVRVRTRTILADVGFDVRPGEIVAVIGPNGAGKTTLLEVIAGVRPADRGTVAFRGAPAASFSERARRIAFLPDRTEPAAELRVGDVVRHALRFRPRG